MKRFLIPLVFVLLALALAAIVPDTPAGSPSQAGEDAQTSGAPAGGAQEETEPPETFVPSEKLPADSAISFPVDI